VLTNTIAVSTKFVKALCPELLAVVIFDGYDQHSQIITDLDIKLNKWHITIEKLYRKPTETEQIKKKLWPDSGIEPQPEMQQPAGEGYRTAPAGNSVEVV